MGATLSNPVLFILFDRAEGLPAQRLCAERISAAEDVPQPLIIPTIVTVLTLSYKLNR